MESSKSYPIILLLVENNRQLQAVEEKILANLIVFILYLKISLITFEVSYFIRLSYLMTFASLFNIVLLYLCNPSLYYLTHISLIHLLIKYVFYKFILINNDLKF